MEEERPTHREYTLDELCDPLLVPGRGGRFLLFEGNPSGGVEGTLWVADLTKGAGGKLGEVVHVGRGTAARCFVVNGMTVVVALRNEVDARGRPGRLVWYSSMDLEQWKDHGDVFPGEGLYRMFDVAEVEGRWTILTAEVSSGAALESPVTPLGTRRYRWSGGWGGWEDAGLDETVLSARRFRLLSDGCLVTMSPEAGGGSIRVSSPRSHTEGR